MLIIMHIIINTYEGPSSRMKIFGIVNLRGVSTKLYFNLILTMQTYKKHLIELYVSIILGKHHVNLLLQSFQSLGSDVHAK